MEFIQKKTADHAVEHFLQIAADKGISLVWDSYEGQLPECGFCEAGLSCRDCLQGPCISHPFRDSSKLGVCGKDKDILAVQSLLRLVIKGVMAYLDQVTDFVEKVESKEITLRNKAETDRIIKEIQRLFKDGSAGIKREFPKTLIHRWEKIGICPEGLAKDLFKASQKLEGGMASVEETLLWAFKSSLLGCLSQKLQRSLKRSVFGETVPTEVEVNLGVLKKGTPHILIYGPISPILKRMIAKAAEKEKVSVMGVCTDSLLPPYAFSPVTNYGSQEIPLMTGAVDLIVVGDQYVNPSLKRIAKEYEVLIVPIESLERRKDLNGLAKEIVEKARKSFEVRRDIPRDIPETKESAVMGFSVEHGDIKKIINALHRGMIKGIVIFSGSNNVKFTQDKEILTMAQEFLKNDIFCISRGEASVCLAKYGFLNPRQREKSCSKNLLDLLSSLGNDVPSVLDFGAGDHGGIIDCLLSIARIGKKDLKDLPIVACFPEANRSMDVTEAMWIVAMGIPTYFWPSLPVIGSPKTVTALSQFCKEKLGSELHLNTDKKMEPLAKANWVMKNLIGKASPRLSGYAWK